VRVAFGTLRDVDLAARTATSGDGTVRAWDAIVLAPGTVPSETSGLRLRTATDAALIEAAIAKAVEVPWSSTVMVRVLPGSDWSAPAYEFAFLLDAWLRGQALREQVEVVVVTDEYEPFELLGAEPVAFVREELARRGIALVAGVQPQRVEELDGDVTIDVGGIAARRLRGVDHLMRDEFYATDAHGRIAPDAFVVGDAARLRIKAGMVASWQARQVAMALGGDLDRLGTSTDGIPHEELEYQMDLGAMTLVARLDARSMLLGTGLRPARVHVREGVPDKLRGTLTRSLLIGDRMTPTERFHTTLQVQDFLTHGTRWHRP
jgi:hypothetical protein